MPYIIQAHNWDIKHNCGAKVVTFNAVVNFGISGSMQRRVSLKLFFGNKIYKAFLRQINCLHVFVFACFFMERFYN